MKNMNEKKKLPSVVVLNDAMKENKKMFEERFRVLQESFSALKKIEIDIGKIPNDLDLISSGELVRIIDQKIKSVDDMPVPSLEKNKILAGWNSVRDTVIRSTKIIQYFFSEYKDAVCQITDNEEIIITNKNDILSKMSTFPVPEMAQRHYELWCAVEKAVNDLRKWEDEYNVRKIPLTEIIPNALDPDSFARIWSQGHMSKGTNKAFEKLYL